MHTVWEKAMETDKIGKAANIEMAVNIIRKKNIPKPVAQSQIDPAKIQPSYEEMKKAIENLLRKLDSTKELKMYYDRDIKRMVVTIVDSQTQEVVRQSPPPELVSFIKKFQQYIGMLINRRI